jgi:hypothetical protein
MAVLYYFLFMYTLIICMNMLCWIEKLIWIVNDATNRILPSTTKLTTMSLLTTLRNNKYFHLLMMYAIWIIMHYLASHLYCRLCVPLTFFGFLMAPFMVPTPHCQALRWTIYNGGLTITNMWLILGAWVFKNYISSALE